MLAIKDIARRNYILYYVQENLLDLRAQQIAEQKLMDEVEDFEKVLFEVFQSDSIILNNLIYFLKRFVRNYL